MAGKALIIDDEQAAAETLAEMCRGLDLEPVVVHNPADAGGVFNETQPALVIVDLFMPGTDGFQIGRSLRNIDYNVPMLAVSGVIRRPGIAREVKGTFGAEFLAKPCDLNEFNKVVCGLLGREPPAPQETASADDGAIQAFQVDLAKQPVYRILIRLFEAKATGHLDLIRGQARRRLTLQNGWLRYAMSNLKQENAGGMQVAQGTLSEDAFAAAVAHAKQAGVGLGDALVATGAMTPVEMQQAVAAQVRQIATAAMSWGDGTARYTPDGRGVERLPDHRTHPLSVVVEGVRRYFQPQTLRGFLEPRRGQGVRPSPLLSKETYTLRQTTPGEAITIAASRAQTLGDLLERARDEDLPLLFVLIAGGIIRLTGAQADGATGGGSPEVDDAQADAGLQFTAADQEARARIVAELQRQTDATHYEILRISPKADADAIQAAYLALAREWHTDRFSGLNLGSAARKLETVFSQISSAKTVLADEHQRAEYDVYLDRKAKGLPTDIEAILGAEQEFQKGEILLRRGKAQDALARFDEAIRLNHTEPDYFALRGIARYLVGGVSALSDANADVDKALEMRENLPNAWYAKGRIAFGEGELEEAASWLKRAISLSPNNKHPEAEAQLRVVAKRQEGGGDKDGGLFGKLLKR